MSKPRKKVPAKNTKGNHTIEECNHAIHGQFIHHQPKSSKEGKPIITVNYRTGQGKLIIPSREPLDIPGIFPSSDYKRLLKQAKVLSTEEKNAKIREQEELKQKLHQESEKRKELLRKKQVLTAAKGTILEEAEAETMKGNQFMLQRSKDLIRDQEDEIKTLNGIILATKCLAIREAQIKEKKLIEKELAEEEVRLDMLMEQERQRGMKAEKKMQEEQEERNKQFVMQMKNQLRSNELQALIEREKHKEEARHSNELLIIYQQQQMEEMKQKKEKQRKANEELRRMNEENIKYKGLKEEEDRLLDLRLKEFIRIKEEEEKVREEQAKLAKDNKDGEMARIAARVRQQEEVIRKREELNEWRIQEEAEREWRRKEKEAALKRKQGIEKLNKEREEQIMDIRKYQAIEMAKDQEEYYKVCQIQRDEYEKDRQEQKKKQEKAMQNRKDILKQINDREKKRVEERKRVMEEGEAIRLENALRKQQIHETLEQKLESLKECNMPEKTLQDIRRQAEVKIKSRIK